MALLKKWQPAENLISARTLPEIWQRHVADSAQLVARFPQAERWLDIGSGAGFPGLVIAMFMAERTDGRVHLVESNRRKCAFLRAVVRETSAPASVYEGRAEDVLEAWQEPVDRITARAVAPLTTLLSLVAPVMEKGVPAAFLKGQDFRAEVDEASQSWRFDLVKHESLIGEGGVILDINALRPNAESG